jgi:hypothetical protein
MIKKSDPGRAHPEVCTLDAGSDLLTSAPPFDSFFGLDADTARDYPLITERYRAPADRCAGSTPTGPARPTVEGDYDYYLWMNPGFRSSWADVKVESQV